MVTFCLPTASLHQVMGSTAHELPSVSWCSNAIGGF